MLVIIVSSIRKSLHFTVNLWQLFLRPKSRFWPRCEVMLLLSFWHKYDFACMYDRAPKLLLSKAKSAP